MNIAMKQRLVGTIVIGCLAIIFIPVLLDGEGVSPPKMAGTIPESPPIPVIPNIEAARPEIVSDSVIVTEPNRAVDNLETDSVNSPPPAPVRPTLTNSGVPETWTVRLGSFGKLANAEALVSRLRERGYKGYSRPLNPSRGPLTGVYVGPVLTKSEAGSLQQDLTDEFELDGVVVQFSIEELGQ